MRRKSIFLRSYLVILLLCTLTPITLFASWLVVNFARGERESIEDGLQDTTRALTTALDREFQSSIAALNVLASSNHLDAGDYQEFYALSARARATQPGWKTIILHEPSGQPILNILVRNGRPVPTLMDWQSFQKVVQTKRPAIAELVKGPTSGWVFGVRVPVLRQGEVKYVLSAFIDPSRIATIMKEQNLPSSWVGVIHDRSRRVVARTRWAEKFIGHEAGMLKDAMAGSAEGSVRGYNREGVFSYTFFRKSPLSGWEVVLNVPAELLDGPVQRSLMLMIGAGVVALAFGILFALFMSQYINHSVAAITTLAQALGSRKKFKPADKSLFAEVNTITEALLHAANALQESEAKQGQAEEDLRIANSRLEQRVTERTVALDDEIRKKQTLENALRGQAMLLQLTHDAIVVRSFDDGRIQFWNNGASEIYGWNVDEAVGEVMQELLHPRYHESLQDIEEKVAREGHWEGEVIHTRKDGTELILESRWSLRRDLDGRPVAILELNSDVTTRKYAEQKVHENEWLAGVGTMTAMFAHEIANPLNAISTSLAVVEMELEGHAGVDSRVKRTLESSTQEILRLGALLNDFRTIARPQAAKLKPGNLVHLIKDVLVPQIAVCQNAGITIKREFGELQPILMDENKIKQVILNLCKNAIEAMPNGGVLAVRAYQAEGSAVIEVSDTGAGIPEGLDVFQLFKTTKPNGTGLGLPVVRQIIRAHQGHIEYRSEPGQGTTFKIHLRGSVAVDSVEHSRQNAA